MTPRVHVLSGVCILLTGFLVCAEPSSPATGPEIRMRPGTLDAKQLLGHTIRDAVRLAGLKPARCAIFDEPPGVARGVAARTADGKRIHLWLARNDGVFSAQRDWTFGQLAHQKVVAVEVIGLERRR
jgi:hypothetical protein